jgi:hypothetical protein
MSKNGTSRKWWPCLALSAWRPNRTSALSTHAQALHEIIGSQIGATLHADVIEVVVAQQIELTDCLIPLCFILESVKESPWIEPAGHQDQLPDAFTGEALQGLADSPVSPGEIEGIHGVLPLLG